MPELTITNLADLNEAVTTHIKLPKIYREPVNGGDPHVLIEICGFSRNFNCANKDCWMEIVGEKDPIKASVMVAELLGFRDGHGVFLVNDYPFDIRDPMHCETACVHALEAEGFTVNLELEGAL